MYKGKKSLKNILVITQYYYPENFIINGLVKNLANKDCKVCVYTGYPSYPHKEIYDDQNLKYKSINQNIEIKRYPIFLRRNGRINLSLHYVSYIVMGIICSYKVLNKKMKWDSIFVFQTSPVTVILIGAWIKLFTKTKMITWVQDLWPDSIFSHFYSSNNKYPLNSFFRKIISKICIKIYSFSDILLAQSNSYKKELKNNLYNKRIELVFNTIEDQNLYLQKKIITKENKKTLKIVSAGNFSTTIPYDIFINAICSLKERYDNDIVWNFYGNGTKFEYFRNLIDKYKCHDVVRLHGTVEQEKLPEIMMQNDLFLVGLIDEKLISRTCPSRLIYAMANAMPIIASAKGEIAKILDEAQCGFISSPDNYVELTNNIIKFKNMTENEIIDMSNKSFKFYNKNFKKDMVFEKIYNLL